MQAFNNQTGKPHFDAHGREVPPGGIIAFEMGAGSEAEAPPGPAPVDSPAKASAAPQPEVKASKGASK